MPSKSGGHHGRERGSSGQRDFDLAEAALVFEAFCKHRIGGMVPTCLSGEVSFAVKKTLSDYGLILDHSADGHLRIGSILRSNDGGELTAFGDEAVRFVCIPSDTNIPVSRFSLTKENLVVWMLDGQPVVDVTLLTEAGISIAGILPDGQIDALRKLGVAIKDSLKPRSTKLYAVSAKGLSLVEDLSSASSGGEDMAPRDSIS